MSKVTIEELVNAFRAEAAEQAQKEADAKAALQQTIEAEKDIASNALRPIHEALVDLGKLAPECMNWHVSDIQTGENQQQYGWARVDVTFDVKSVHDNYFGIGKQFHYSKFGCRVNTIHGSGVLILPQDHREALIALTRVVGQILANGRCKLH